MASILKRQLVMTQKARTLPARMMRNMHCMFILRSKARLQNAPAHRVNVVTVVSTDVPVRIRRKTRKPLDNEREQQAL